MPVEHIALLLVAAFGGGALNAAAGGGSFLTLPALVFTGVPPLMANATGTAALLPGYAASAWGFREDLQAPKGLSFKVLVVIAACAGALGASVLLITDTGFFNRLLPWLILAATVLFAIGPRLQNALGHREVDSASAGKSKSVLAVVCLYGGYFNGGLGILLLAALTLIGESNLNKMNGIKSLVSAVITAISVSVYAVGGLIAWPQALMMMLSSVAGAYIGARLIRKLPARILRSAIVVMGVLMTLWFFQRV